MQAVSPPALLLFQDFLQETKYNFLHIVVCHMVAAIVRQAGQVASHIAKTACWAHPNPCKMRKCSFAAARSSCAWRERYLHIKKATLHSNLQFFNSFESISSKSFPAYSARGEIPISAHVTPWSAPPEV